MKTAQEQEKGRTKDRGGNNYSPEQWNNGGSKCVNQLKLTFVINWRRVISRLHRLKKTSSKQSKRLHLISNDLHLK